MIKLQELDKELKFKASRSSGPGGQNVNKVNTKVELRFLIQESSILTDLEKEMILQKLIRRINSVGELLVVSESERTQLKNKEKVIEKFHALIKQALHTRKKRKKRKPSQASIKKRLEGKRRHALKKSNRKKPETT